MEFFLQSGNLPFSISLATLLGIGLLELGSFFVGFSLSHLLDHSGIHHEVDTDVDHLSLFAKFIGWLRYKNTPLIVLIISFLAEFSLIGLSLQFILKQVINVTLPWYIAVIPTFLVTLPLLRLTSMLLGKIIMKDETTAVDTVSFRGLYAVIVIGTAERGSPTQAKVVDCFGQSHYIMVEPFQENMKIEQNQKVLLLNKKDDTTFYVEPISTIEGDLLNV